MDPLRLEALDNHDNQPAMGAMKTGGGWQEGIDEATTQPRRWATTNNKGVRRMVMAVTKRGRMARAMVMAMRVLVNEEGEGGTGHGVNEGGMRQRGRRRRRQEQWQRGWQMSNGNNGNGNRRQTTINQQLDQQRRAVAGKRVPMRQPHDHDGGRQQTTRACSG